MTGCVIYQMQNADDGDVDSSGQDLMELIHLTRRHISEVARLEGLRGVDVEVTDTRAKAARYAQGAGVAANGVASVGTCAVRKW